ncbi:MAG TPA: hypothetical protein VKA27_12420 [Sunxiuqinia sp.]|nr:hypothetical protein [Sunxiuqinia sp.]
MEHRQVTAYQQDLFVEQKQNAICLSAPCKDVHQAKAGQARQINKAGQRGRALTENLMTTVCSSHNLKQAYKQVKRNKGVAGIDQMPTGKFADRFIEKGDFLQMTCSEETINHKGLSRLKYPNPKEEYVSLVSLQ